MIFFLASLGTSQTTFEETLFIFSDSMPKINDTRSQPLKWCVLALVDNFLPGHPGTPLNSKMTLVLSGLSTFVSCIDTT